MATPFWIRPDQSGWGGGGGGGGGGGTQYAFVYRPGGVASGNVYTDIALLDAAMAAVQGPKLLQWDGELAPISIPAGTYNGIGDNATWQPYDSEALTFPVDVTFAAGAVLGRFPEIIRGEMNVNLVANGTPTYTAPVDSTTNVTVMDGAVLRADPTSVTVPIQVVNDGFFMLSLPYNGQALGQIKPATLPLLNLQGTATLEVFVGEGSTLNLDALSGDLASTATVITAATGASIAAQPLVLGTYTPVNVTNATRLFYAPTTPADWPIVPDDVAEALDILAAAAGGGAGYALGVDTIVDRNAIPLGDRSEFMSVFVRETDRWYTLIGGTADVNWTLRDTARKVDDRPGLVGPIYVDAAGSDINGTGSIGAPYATLTRALLDLGTARANVNIDINVGAGVFAPPDTWVNANWVTVVGTTSNFDTGTVDGAPFWSPFMEWLLDLTLAGGPYLANDLKGRLININSGAFQGWIYANDATVAGMTRVYLTADTLTDFAQPAALDPVVILNLDTTIRDGTAAVASYLANTRLNFQECTLEAAAATHVHFFASTDKVEFVRCKIQNLGRYQAGQGGGFFLTNCYYAPNGAAGNGILRVAPGGLVRLLQGTVIDGGASITEGFVTDPNALLSYIGRSAFIDVQSVTALSSDWSPGSAESSTINPCFFFGGTAMMRGGMSWNTSLASVGGEARLPTLVGSVTSAYAVTGIGGARISMRMSAINSTLGVNYTSADNGMTNVAQYLDGTIVEGGNVNPGGYTARATTIVDYFLGQTDNLLLVDASGGPVNVTLPFISQYPNRSYTVKKIDGSANAVTVLPSFGATIDGAGSYIILTPNEAREFTSGSTATTDWAVT